MDIVIQGKPRAVIVLPGAPTPREIFAGEELQKYVSRITGIKIDMVSDRETENTRLHKIIIGGPDRNAAAAKLIGAGEFDRIAPGPEGFLIKTFGWDTLLLAGSDRNRGERERGTVYAVYELLERYFQCSFTAYGCPGSEIGETVPRCDSLCLDNVAYSMEKAGLSYRTSIVQFESTAYAYTPGYKLMPAFAGWMAKNRYNRVMLFLDVYEKLKKTDLFDEFVKRGIQMTAGHHNSGMFFLPPDGSELFPEKYYQTHPEYYKLGEDGVRFKPGGVLDGQFIFDMRNMDCIRQIAANTLCWLDINTEVDIVCFWPNDGLEPQCCCCECSRYTKTVNYVFMANEIAKIVYEKYPHVFTSCLPILPFPRTF